MPTQTADLTKSTNVVKPTPALIKKFQACRIEDKREVVERDEEVDTLYCCLLAMVHVLFLGDPGLAKSLMLRLMHGHIPTANYFETLVFKQAPADGLVGPISVKGLKQDEYRRVTRGKLPEAHMGFVDEVFKSTASALNALLAILADNLFHDNGTGAPTQVPLWFGSFASNELPNREREDLIAFTDRISVIREVQDVRSDDSVIKIVQGQLMRGRGEAINPTLTELTVAEVEQAQREVWFIDISEETMRMYARLKRECHDGGMPMNPRRGFTGLRMAQARAYLAGRTEVLVDDFKVFQDIIPREPDQRDDAYKILIKYASKYERQTNEIREGFETINGEFESLKSGGKIDPNEKERMEKALRVRLLHNNTKQKLTELIEQAQSDNADTGPMDELVTQIQSNQDWLQEHVFKSL